MKPNLVERLTSLGPVIQEICKVAGTPGLSLGVAQHGKIIHTANYGYQDIEASISPNPDTLYGIASITKIFTASAVGILVDEGKLEWTTPIKTILPELNTVDPYITCELTVIDLLTHRIGLEKSNNWWFGSDGVLLLNKNQTLSRFNHMKKIAPFRTKFDYTNWGFALAGEIIEKLSGKSYGDYIQSKILDPLNLKRTTANRNCTTLNNFAKPYASLDDRSMHLLPPPPVQDGTIMVAAQGLQSSVNDLLKFSSAFMQACRGEPSPLKNAAKQSSGHIFRSDSFLDKSYGLGLMRNQLPNTIGGGCNAQFGKLPIITPGENTRLVLSHGGSQAGYTSFLTMLPEADLSLVVLTNSIGLADPSGWVNELLIASVVDSPGSTDFVQLARDAASKHIESYPAMERQLEECRVHNTSHKPLEQYVGQYINDARDFIVDIRVEDETKLQVAFQGLDTQVWSLRHYQDDTFLWLTSRDEQAKRARFTYSPSSIYKIIFSTDDNNLVNGLYWPHEPSVPQHEQWYEKMSGNDYKMFKEYHRG